MIESQCNYVLDALRLMEARRRGRARGPPRGPGGLQRARPGADARHGVDRGRLRELVPRRPAGATRRCGRASPGPSASARAGSSPRSTSCARRGPRASPWPPERPRRAPTYRRCYTDVTVAMIDQGLLEGAHRAIERWGWRQATLERIATEAGVSRMTLHRRGVTRDGLLGALSERLEDALSVGHVARADRERQRPRAPRAGAGRLLRGGRGQPRAAGRAGRGRPQRDLPRGGPARADAARPSPSRSGGCCRTARPTARWPTRTPRRPRRCCSTSSAGPTATCAAATAGTPSAPATACCASRWTGWPRGDHRRARSPRPGGPRLRARVRRHGAGRGARRCCRSSSTSAASPTAPPARSSSSRASGRRPSSRSSGWARIAWRCRG